MSRGAKRVVMFSGGVGSWAAAKRVAQQHGTGGLTLLFTDTRCEHPDTYRFLIESGASVLGLPIRSVQDLASEARALPTIAVTDADQVNRSAAIARLQWRAVAQIPGLAWIADGRTIWDVFRDVRFLGNNGTAPCSRILKQDMSRAWCREHCDPAATTFYVGIDWTEEHRFTRPGFDPSQPISDTNKPGLRERMALEGWRYEAPLCDPPYVSKEMMHDLADQSGIAKQELYCLGAEHANCGGLCVRMGIGGFARAKSTMPEKFAEWERREQELRDDLGADVAILRDRRGGETKPLTLTALRERLESGGQCDMFDIGGCGCFVDEPQLSALPNTLTEGES